MLEQALQTASPPLVDSFIGEPKPFKIGDAVLLAVPLAIRDVLDDEKLLCRVVGVETAKDGTPRRFVLRCNAGVLEHKYPAGSLSDGSTNASGLNFTDTRRQGIPTVPLRTAVVAANAERRCGQPAAVRCGCKTCGPRCPCRQAGKACSRLCKGHKKNCMNWDD